MRNDLSMQKGGMPLRSTLLSWSLSIFIACHLTAQQEPSRPSRSAGVENVTTSTGVVDQVGDKFVLAGEEAIRPRAVLRAEGFSPDNFARFVGQRVEIRGRLISEGDQKILVVKSVRDIKRIDRTPPKSERQQPK